MKMINHLRDIYGFPQAVLARYVGVSRGHLSMAAIGRKDLQTAAYLKLGKLALAVKNEEGPELEAVKAAHRRLQTEKESVFVKSKMLETQYRLMSCQRKLRRMRVKYRQATHAIACLAVLQANPGDPDINHYRVMEMEARELLDKNSETAQFEIELRIEGLKATAECLRRRVELADSLAVLPPDTTNPGMDEPEPVEIFARETLEENVETAEEEVASPVEGVKVKAVLLPVPVVIEGGRVILPAPHRGQYKVMDLSGRRLPGKNREPAWLDMRSLAKGFKGRANFCERGWPLPG